RRTLAPAAPGPRRAFLGALPAGPVAAMAHRLGLAERPRVAATKALATMEDSKARGLLSGISSSDFLFAPGLVYLQTASLGPTPKPVMDRTLAAWRELELNPKLYGYGALEQAMEDVSSGDAALVSAAEP